MSENDAINIYDEAMRALSSSPDSVTLRYQAVLALARVGALERACRDYERYGLDAVSDDEDIISLGGRLLKDIALEQQGADRLLWAKKSLKKYKDAYAASHGFYSAINVATMSLVAGEAKDKVSAHARAARDAILRGAETASKSDAYFKDASKAEIALLEGDIRTARKNLQAAISHDRLNYAAHATTIKQFEMILGVRGEPAGWLDVLRPPKAAHFAGHMFALADHGPALSDRAAEALRLEVADVIQRRDIGFGYGALAAGADILIAETLLDEGGELHVVLPVEDKRFIDSSVLPFGEQWVERFAACKARAHSVRYPALLTDWPDGKAAHFASQIAMGAAAKRAKELSTSAEQLLIWDGADTGGAQGTARDAQTWRHTQRAQSIIAFPAAGRARKARKHKDKSDTTTAECIARASLVVSMASDDGLDAAGAALLVDRYREDIGKIASRFDGRGAEAKPGQRHVMVEFSSVSKAAQCALAIMDQQRSRKNVMFASQDMDIIRIGAHCAPGTPDQHLDPDKADLSVAIAETAPPGAIYVSEEFAAILEVQSPDEFRHEYVGRRAFDLFKMETALFSLRAVLR